MKKFNMNNCPLTAALKVVGGKWKPIIIINLGKSSKRFGQLDFAIPEISRKVLTTHLSELVRDGMVIRNSFPETPPRVEYKLTEKARELVPILKNFGEWGRFLLEEEHQGDEVS
ncbi:MAG: winged helix-turn-helix transcriptional regulator [Crocinitomicaceae bacterium]